MKKVFVLLVVMMFCAFSFAQNVTYVNQGFGTVPPTGWTIDAHATNWSSVSSEMAGGTAPELRFYYSPQFTDSSQFISPSFDVSASTSLYLSFKHFVDFYATPFTVGVKTRANGGPWHTVWSSSPSANVGPATVLLNITNGDQTSTAFQFCFFFKGNSFNIDYWYIDDLVLYEPCAVDGAMSKITTSPYAGQGNVNIAGTAKNMGTTNITSLDVKYKIGSGGTVQTTYLTGLNIAPGATYNFTCTPAWAATPGNYTAYVWATNANGAGTDCNTVNDTLKKNISIASQSVTRLPLYEEFTSSTCSPCASFNSSTFTPFISAHDGEFSLVKYQMNWPGTGDPYYTAEGGTRRTYYGVNGVPDLFIDGAPSAMASAGMDAELAAEISKGTFFAITQTPSYNGNNISMPVTITPYITGTFKVYVVIVEKTTTGNVGTNGETSWKHVMMKMMPNGSGSSVNFVDGTPYTNTFSYTKAGTDHIEEMTDLQCVIFVQEASTKEVFQSSFVDIALEGIANYSDNNISIYPNPATDNVSIVNAQHADLKLFDMYGKLIVSENNISNNYLLNVSDLSIGTYVIRLVSGDKVISRKIDVVK